MVQLIHYTKQSLYYIETMDETQRPVLVNFFRKITIKGREALRNPIEKCFDAMMEIVSNPIFRAIGSVQAFCFSCWCGTSSEADKNRFSPFSLFLVLSAYDRHPTWTSNKLLTLAFATTWPRPMAHRSTESIQFYYFEYSVIRQTTNYWNLIRSTRLCDKCQVNEKKRKPIVFVRIGCVCEERESNGTDWIRCVLWCELECSWATRKHNSMANRLASSCPFVYQFMPANENMK